MFFSEKRFFVLGVYLFSQLAIQHVFKTVTCTAFQSDFGICLKLKVKECFLMMWRTSLSETTLISYTCIIKKQIQNLLLWIVFVQFLCNSRYYWTVWLYWNFILFISSCDFISLSPCMISSKFLFTLELSPFDFCMFFDVVLYVFVIRSLICP